MARQADRGDPRARSADRRPAPSSLGPSRAAAICSTSCWPTSIRGTTSSRPCLSSAARAIAPAAPRRCADRRERVCPGDRRGGRPARRQDQNLRRHRQLRRSAAAECRCGARRPDRRGRRPVSRHPPDRGARPGDRRRLILCAAAGADGRPEFPPRPEAAAGARSDLRGLDLPPADQDPDRSGARSARR